MVISFPLSNILIVLHNAFLFSKPKKNFIHFSLYWYQERLLQIFTHSAMLLYIFSSSSFIIFIKLFFTLNILVILDNNTTCSLSAFFAKAFEIGIFSLGTYILQKCPFTLIGKCIIWVKENLVLLIKIFIYKNQKLPVTLL